MVDGGAAAHAGDRLAGPRRAGATIFTAVLMPLLAVYSLTATWQYPIHVDTMTNAITGWYIGNEGTTIADQHDVLVDPDRRLLLGWFGASPEGTVSQYPPGAALAAGLLYALAPDDKLVDARMVSANRPGSEPVTVPVPPLWPATLSAVVCTALVGAVIALIAQRLGLTPLSAVAVGFAFGLGTGAWSVAADGSWTHGPAMLSVVLALLAAQRDRWSLAGVAFAAAVLTRPHLAVVPAVMGVGLLCRRRELWPTLRLGMTSLLGLAALLAYNQAVWHRWTITGGYSKDFAERFVGSSPSWFVRNVWGALFDLDHGLVVWAPFVVLLLVGAVIAHRQVPDWATWAAVGGAVYLLVQLRSNRFSGGDGHFGYRYPLEALTAAAPLLIVGFKEWVRTRVVARGALAAALAVGFLGQLHGAIIGPL